MNDTITNYTSIYLVRHQIGPNLPPEQRYAFGSTSAPDMTLLGYVVGPSGFPGVGSRAMIPTELIKAAIAGEAGLSWEPAPEPSKPKLTEAFLKAAELEAEHGCSVGGLAVELGLYKAEPEDA